MKNDGDILGQHDARKKRYQSRAAEIRMIADSELPGILSPNELIGERNRRWYWAKMDQVNLEFHATYDPDAAAEVKRRLGELPR